MNLTTEQLEAILTAIHARPHMIVLEFAGAGAQALAWLHSVGGSSRTILEASDRYAGTSLMSAIGYKPKRSTSPRVARAMATRAYIRARELSDSNTPVAGIGCTATIATDRIKRGDHRCSVTICDDQGITSYRLKMSKGKRTRQEEEQLVSLLILRALADLCGVGGLPEPVLASGEAIITNFERTHPLARVMAQEVDWAAVAPNGQITTGKTLPNIALLSGSFNPLHDGHRKLSQVVAEMLGQAVYFELPLINADKAPISLVEARRRAAQFAGFATILFTRTPLFTQKAVLFPNSVFIVGADTAERLVQLRFYHNDQAEMEAAFEALKAANCRFLVAGRLRGNAFLTLQDLALPKMYRALFDEIPADRFRLDISSSAIRAFT